jgi:SH3 domain-containing YSC84-like protein 1
MKKVMLFFAMLSLGTLCWAESAREDATERLGNATTVLHEIMGMPDKGIPEEVLEHAKCIAVVPHMVKGGFIFGGKGGKGVATCRTAKGWSAPAFITISGGNWGLQIGVEAVDLVLIIQNEKGMQKLLESNFHLGADASAAAGLLSAEPSGRDGAQGWSRARCDSHLSEPVFPFDSFSDASGLESRGPRVSTARRIDHDC